VKPRPLSCSSDRSLRLWNVHDETHLVFRGHKSAIDCAQYLTLDSYISSGEDGNICLWKETQKKPVSTIPCAHGMNGAIPHWITSMTSLKISDLFATGSSDGYLNFWKGTAEKNGLELMNKWLIGPGFINGIALSSRFVVLGIGSEHRLGRWERIKSVRNRIELIKLPTELSDEDQASLLEDSEDDSNSDESSEGMSGSAEEDEVEDDDSES
jgi:ribosomal RNA-processing protein 9